ncbi:hypothetical protein BGZ46_001828 [Entomortierella lignicola]|nr:hypothetical protein BGZ46_001828 [Entomortierella lignicola]
MTIEDFFPQTSQRKNIDIGNGLIMRWSTKTDADNVATLLMDAFRWSPFGDPLPQDRAPGPNEFTGAAARRLFRGKSAVMRENDFALVEDTKREEGRNPIVACVALMRQKFFYGSVVLNLGVPELVATDTEYRNRGLIKRLFLEMIHPESDARGDVLQFIAGIPYFYRQFGYGYGLHLYNIARIDNPNIVPPLGKDQVEPFTLRRATLNDVDFLLRLSTPEKLHQNTTISTFYSRRYWEYTVHEAFEDKQHRFDAERETNIIVETKSGNPVGFTVASSVFFGPELEAFALDEDLTSFVEVKDSVLRQLFERGTARKKVILKEAEEARKLKAENEQVKEAEEAKKAEAGSENEKATETTDTTISPAPAPAPSPPFVYKINLHPLHPLSALLGNSAKRDPNGPSIYTRIYNYPAFIKAVAPELEKRLANSPIAGVTGRLRLDFYRQVEGSSGKGLEVFFEKGKIVDAKEWARPSPEEKMEESLNWMKENYTPVLFNANLAPLTFTNLLTGKDSLQDLTWAYGESFAYDDTTTLLLNTLFPKSEHRLDIFIW